MTASGFTPTMSLKFAVQHIWHMRYTVYYILLGKTIQLHRDAIQHKECVVLLFNPFTVHCNWTSHILWSQAVTVF